MERRTNRNSGNTVISPKSRYSRLQKNSRLAGVYFLCRTSGSEAHFMLITYWNNWEALRQFAGEDVEKAKYFPEDNDFLLEFEENVQHFEVFAHEDFGIRAF